MAQIARSTRASSTTTSSAKKVVAKTKPPVDQKVKATAKAVQLRAVKGGASAKETAPPLKAVATKAATTATTPVNKTPNPPGASLPKSASTPPVAPPTGYRSHSGVVPKGYVPLVNIPPLPPPPKNLKLEVGDKAVHPAHGLGEIIAIEHREIGGAKGEFFIIRILDNGMRVMVPRTSAQAAGLRPVMSTKEADKVLDTMKAREVAVDLQPWSRRFRAYTEMIKSGSPHEVAKVLRDMYRLKFDKELSFGERRLLDQAKSLLMKELAAAKGVTEPVLQARVDEMFRT
jgi:CarD family transcriptional regulator